MKINLKQTLLITLLSVFSFLSYAHEITQNKALITLRDGQVEIKLTIDEPRWHQLLTSNQAWLLGDIDTVMPLELTQTQEHQYFEKELIQNTQIKINNKSVSLALSSMNVEVHNTALSHHDEEATMTVVLMGKHTQADPAQLTIQFPKSLGAIHTSIVQPTYRLIAPASAVQVIL